MIKNANQNFISDVFPAESPKIYNIPKYQREYTWGRKNWEELFNDLIENEKGYFLGSLIAIDSSSDSLRITEFEIIDGQQRLTTISLLFAAIYKVYSEFEDNDKLELQFIERKLAFIDSQKLVLNLQIQNNNLDDYKSIIKDLGILFEGEKPKNAGNRNIYRAYRFFIERINEYLDEGENDKNELVKKLIGKINSAIIVFIEVESYSDAFKLFESLNHRGMPLSAIDLIKNFLLSSFKGQDIDSYFLTWNSLLDYLGDDYKVQERFFRQYYNAFKSSLNEPFRKGNKKGEPLGSIATRSNLLSIFEKLIKNNPEEFLRDIVECGKEYSIIIGKNTENIYNKLFNSLERIQGAPSYLLMLFLFKNKEYLDLDEDNLEEIINLLIKFFVRRNLTNSPPTQRLSRFFMNITENLVDKKAQNVVDYIHNEIINISENDKIFEEKLRGSIYSENIGVTRFILSYIAESYMNLENSIDLWQRTKNHFVWTIEHIFPQGENIPAEWVDMIADGDKKKATLCKDKYVHTLGNLTLSGYNNTLSNKSFEIKRDRTDKNGQFIGYKNNLILNEDLKDETNWNVDKIKKRTDRLVNESLKLFSLKKG